MMITTNVFYNKLCDLPYALIFSDQDNLLSRTKIYTFSRKKPKASAALKEI